MFHFDKKAFVGSLIVLNKVVPETIHTLIVYIFTIQVYTFAPDPVNFIASTNLILSLVQTSSSFFFFKIMRVKPRKVINIWFCMTSILCLVYFSLILIGALDGNIGMEILIGLALVNSLLKALTTYGGLYYTRHFMIEIANKYSTSLAFINSTAMVGGYLTGSVLLLLVGVVYQYLPILTSTSIITLSCAAVSIIPIILLWRPLENLNAIEAPLKKSRFLKAVLSQLPVYYNQKIFLILMANTLGGIGLTPTMLQLYLLDQGISVVNQTSFHSVTTLLSMIVALCYPLKNKMNKSVNLFDFVIGILLVEFLFGMYYLAYVIGNINNTNMDEVALSDLSLFMILFLIINLLAGLLGTAASLAIQEIIQIMVPRLDRGAVAGIEHLLSALMPMVKLVILLAIPSYWSYIVMFLMALAVKFVVIVLYCVNKYNVDMSGQFELEQSDVVDEEKHRLITDTHTDNETHTDKIT